MIQDKILKLSVKGKIKNIQKSNSVERRLR